MASDIEQIKEMRKLIEETDQIRGVGDVVARVTKKLGIRECEGCKKRRRWLNEHLPLGKEKRA